MNYLNPVGITSTYETPPPQRLLVEMILEDIEAGNFTEVECKKFFAAIKSKYGWSE